MDRDKINKMSVDELEKAVAYHNRLYFIEHKPEISDYDFDQLVEALKARNPDSKVLHEIGSDLSRKAQKVKHEVAMLSLDKAYDIETMSNWASKFEGGVIASPKIDGVAISIKYDENGDLVQAATRGSGVEGELVTKNIYQVKSIPKKIELKNVEIRGEVYMPLSVFKKYSEEFANPRNLAAGAIKQKDPKKTGEYNIAFWAYDILGSDAKTEVEKRELFKANKIPTVEWKLIKKDEIQGFFEVCLEKRDMYDFETDGVVYKTNIVSEQVSLGVTAHHPRYAIAYKFQGDSGETTLVDIEWSVARTGVITPVGIVEPVELSGATVTRASLHNYGLMKKLGLSKGAKVLMMRRGGVIPKLEKVVKEGGAKIKMPKSCPSCGSPVEIKDDFLYCSNPDECVQKRIAELEHFIKTIECDGFGIKLVTKLYEEQLVVEPSDFYKLTKEDLLKLERMGDVLAEKLIRNINGKRELSLSVFLRSLGIRELGRHVATILEERHGDLKDGVLTPTKEELADIHTIGDVIAGYIVDGLAQKRESIDKLLKEVKIKKGSLTKEDGKLDGKKFLFTGSMVSMGRKEAQMLVSNNGGKIASSVTKDLDFLVIGDGGGAGSKLTKAEKLMEKGAELKIISESNFLKMIKK